MTLVDGQRLQRREDERTGFPDGGAGGVVDAPVATPRAGVRLTLPADLVVDADVAGPQAFRHWMGLAAQVDSLEDIATSDNPREIA